MRIRPALAWLILALSFFTSGLLRQFNGSTPVSPYVPPIVGSLLFAAILILLLVSAREWRLGAVPGNGIRLGSLTPILLMLLIEKWISLGLYRPIFYWLSPDSIPAALRDAQFRGFAGLCLLLVCLLLGGLSRPSARKTWRRARPSRWPLAAMQVTLIVGGTYLVLGLLSSALGAGLTLRWPEMNAVLPWILVGQAVLAFSEETYYRGLLMSEMERLAPRLGAGSPAVRRWVALGFTSTLFAMEHVRVNAAPGDMARQLVFTACLGLLFGLLIMISANLHLVGGIHAWINWLLLGAAPYFVDASGQPALPPGTYIGLTLVLSFVMALVFGRLGIARPSYDGRGMTLTGRNA